MNVREEPETRAKEIRGVIDDVVNGVDVEWRVGLQ